MAASFSQAPLWEPPEETLREAEMARYMRWAGERRGTPFATYEELWRWSVDELEDFWASIWDFCEVRASVPYERVLGSHEMPGTRWFEGARLNYAENLLEGHADGELAVLASSEARPDSELTWGELRELVAAAAATSSRSSPQVSSPSARVSDADSTATAASSWPSSRFSA